MLTFNGAHTIPTCWICRYTANTLLEMQFVFRIYSPEFYNRLVSSFCCKAHFVNEPVGEC